MAKMTICVSRPTQYVERNGGPATSSTATAIRTGSRQLSSTPDRRSPAAIQPRRLDGQHEHHRRKEREVRELRHERLAEVVDHADGYAADEGALETAHAADDDDDKRERQEIEVNPRVAAEDRP